MNKITNYDPVDFPNKKSGKLSCKIKAKTDYIRKDGTCALYIQVFIDGQRKRIPLEISINPRLFDDKKQLVKGSSQLSKDYNLIIGKKLGDINKIAVSYRLAGRYLTMANLLEDLNNPSANIDFINFFEQELKKQVDLLKKGTYKQQESTLRKLKGFKNTIFFYEINEELITAFIIHCKKNLKNQDITIQTALKNIKKFLHIANIKGIKTDITYKDISIKRHKGNRTFLDASEIKLLYEYRNSKFITNENRNILDRFLFACFTGLRISDIQKLTKDNLIGGFVAFKAEKTAKFQKIKLNETAKKFINKDSVFLGSYSDQHINRQLKVITKVCKIKKNISFHVSRHSFATNYLIKGGRVENLQKLLAHSSINETMIYVHIVDNLLDNEITNLDNLLI
ncbi:tyrosine-type recombinase/integrase [Tenacibaculum piscium]|uniref:site-specific integrase n=1 Tax=Tenacibaculum piscium TaxID=1458515 RepID=UPI00187B307E|nr:site-specific integrase [Tenacibaculum piscium]MBE7684590.1 tyrosine-type recombinase/integrase [Tenacibaculum piscium]MBE7689210.1 tyrosine-type recombinase/integrase [Tenacibaculum piscium]